MIEVPEGRPSSHAVKVQALTAVIGQLRRTIIRVRLLQTAGCERQMGRALEQIAFLRRECSPVLLRIDEPIALRRVQAPHAANGAIEGLAPRRRQLAELLKELVRLLLLAGRQTFPRLHAPEHALLLLGRQVRKMLQAILQLPLLGWWKPAKLRIIFKSAALLRGRQIFIAAKPVSGVAGLIGRPLIPWRLISRSLVLRKLVTLRLPTKAGRVRLHSLLRRP